MRSTAAHGPQCQLSPAQWWLIRLERPLREKGETVALNDGVARYRLGHDVKTAPCPIEYSIDVHFYGFFRIMRLCLTSLSDPEETSNITDTLQPACVGQGSASGLPDTKRNFATLRMITIHCVLTADLAR